MCEPTTIMAASLAMSAAAAGIGAYGQYQQGKYQEKVAENNAIVQNRMAEDALKRGEAKEQQHRQQVQQMISRQRTQLAANGVDMQGGSALDMIGDTAMMGELDALTIRSNAANEAYGHRVGATNTLAQGKLDRMAGNYGAASTLLTGAGKVAGSWSQHKAAKGE